MSNKIVVLLTANFFGIASATLTVRKFESESVSNTPSDPNKYPPLVIRELRIG